MSSIGPDSKLAFAPLLCIAYSIFIFNPCLSTSLPPLRSSCFRICFQLTFELAPARGLIYFISPVIQQAAFETITIVRLPSPLFLSLSLLFLPLSQTLAALSVHRVCRPCALARSFSLSLPRSLSLCLLIDERWRSRDGEDGGSSEMGPYSVVYSSAEAVTIATNVHLPRRARPLSLSLSVSTPMSALTFRSPISFPFFFLRHTAVYNASRYECMRLCNYIPGCREADL